MSLSMMLMLVLKASFILHTGTATSDVNQTWMFITGVIIGKIEFNADFGFNLSPLSIPKYFRFSILPSCPLYVAGGKMWGAECLKRGEEWTDIIINNKKKEKRR